jgi:hypothetical protein
MRAASAADRPKAAASKAAAVSAGKKEPKRRGVLPSLLKSWAARAPSGSQRSSGMGEMPSEVKELCHTSWETLHSKEHFLLGSAFDFSMALDTHHTASASFMKARRLWPENDICILNGFTLIMCN